jgi:hypothetical protein
VLDEDARPLKDASIWLGGREYAAEKDGTIAIPFSAQPARESILLRHGELTSLDAFDHRAETYRFCAGLFVDRESLIRRAEAPLLIRPSLRIHDAPASLKLVEDASLQVRSTDRFGVESTMEIRGLELHEDRETLVPFQVPEDLVSITFTVRGRVENLAQGKKVDLSDSRTFTLNEIERTEKTEDLHLARSEKGFVLYVLGKSGEARPDTPVNLSLAHNHFTFEMTFTLQTDARSGSPAVRRVCCRPCSMPPPASRSASPSWARRCAAKRWRSWNGSIRATARTASTRSTSRTGSWS